MADEQAVISTISLKSHLFNYFLWEYHFSFTPFSFIPIFSEIQPKGKIRPTCIVML